MTNKGGGGVNDMTGRALVMSFRGGGGCFFRVRDTLVAWGIGGRFSGMRMVVFSGFLNWFCFGVYSFTVESVCFVVHHKQCCRNVLLKHNLLLGHPRLFCLNPWLRGSCIRESVVTEEQCRRNRLKSSRKAFSSE